ncbi:MAG TPA: Ig-like domain-containing protein, partial [Actinomycetota bacterium]|nr:Ig-like domain-containing protein [Actinomycetota bacterium]
QVETGITPLALAQSLDGSVIAVANFGSRSLSIFRTGGGLALLRSLPEVGRPGDRIGVQAGAGLFAAGSQVDLGAGPFPVSYRTPGGEAAAFVVPAGAQREASLTGVDPLGTRTLALPFRVVDPIGALAPQPTGVQLALAPISCLEGGVGALDALRISPDGGLLALVRNPGGCAGPLELYAADARRPKEFTQALSRADLVPAGHVIGDAAFTSDGRRLWIVDADLSLRIADSDRSSPTFGSLLSVIGFPVFPLSGPGAVATDPLGRYMCAGDMTDDTVRIFRPDGTPVARIPSLGTTDALAASPDGRVLVRAGGGRAEFFNLESLSPIGVSLVHGAKGVGAQHLGVAIPAGGNRAVVRFSNGIGLYNLDPGAGTIGAELYFGNPLSPGVEPGELVPGPGGGDVLAACAACDTLLRIDAASSPPAISYAPVGQRASRLAASPDGRMLWLARSIDVFTGDVKLLSLSPASALALVSGGGQSGLALSTLPVPVRVRATSGIGSPESGVVVRFALGSGGALDSDSTTVYKLTDANGEAEVAWRLGAVLGTENLTVTALGVPGGTLTVSAQVVGDDSQIVPAVIEFGPPNGAVNVATGTPVYVRFNQKMQPASVGAKLKLFANGGPVAGTLSFQDGGRLVLDQPTQPLLFAARCSLTVEAGALDTDGQALPASVFATFTVQAPPPLAVTALSPTAGPVGAAVLLNGTGFSSLPGQNTLLFNGTPTTVTSASPTSLGGRVPPGAATGPVTVQVGAAVSPGVLFTVLAPSGPLVDLAGEIAAGVTPTKVAITSDGGRAYVTNPGSNTVTALDL